LDASAFSFSLSFRGEELRDMAVGEEGGSLSSLSVPFGDFMPYIGLVTTVRGDFCSLSFVLPGNREKRNGVIRFNGDLYSK